MIANVIRVCADARQLAQPREELDQMGLSSLLQFGAVVPPSTIWRQVSRFMPGRNFSIDPSSNSCNDIGLASVCDDVPHEEKLTTEAPADLLVSVIDDILVAACPDKNPVILFSGGVDSGVLAARVAALGWKDAVLLNYAMGPDDAESIHAEVVAKHLGLAFRRIVRNVEFGDKFLEHVGRFYRQPFGDVSCIPTLETGTCVR